jgi:hypothetical protein
VFAAISQFIAHSSQFAVETSANCDLRTANRVGGILLISFIWGCETHKGKKEEWWDLHYTFADQSGAQHENTIEIWNDEEAARWKVGDSGKVRYHPDFPEEHRWLE